MTDKEVVGMMGSVVLVFVLIFTVLYLSVGMN